ncbi:hypothetical protein [Pararhizobium sp. O133]|uniref:hypothetical protein n=1 Tax=Pararhizobium sp. O133 TaxID=3449278 RepID=UPI003F684D2B
MNLIYNDAFNGQSHTVSLPDFDILKVFIYGSIDVAGQDRILGIRVNKSISGYRSYVIQDGGHKEGRNDDTCFVLGRTAWNLMARIGVEYTLFKSVGITGIGQTTFYHKANSGALGALFCGECRGAFDPFTSIESITFFASGGHFDGRMKLYTV